MLARKTRLRSQGVLFNSPCPPHGRNPRPRHNTVAAHLEKAGCKHKSTCCNGLCTRSMASFATAADPSQLCLLGHTLGLPAVCLPVPQRATTNGRSIQHVAACTTVVPATAAGLAAEPMPFMPKGPQKSTSTKVLAPRLMRCPCSPAPTSICRNGKHCRIRCHAVRVVHELVEVGQHLQMSSKGCATMQADSGDADLACVTRCRTEVATALTSSGL